MAQIAPTLTISCTGGDLTSSFCLSYQSDPTKILKWFVFPMCKTAVPGLLVVHLRSFCIWRSHRWEWVLRSTKKQNMEVLAGHFQVSFWRASAFSCFLWGSSISDGPAKALGFMVARWMLGGLALLGNRKNVSWASVQSKPCTAYQQKHKAHPQGCPLPTCRKVALENLIAHDGMNCPKVPSQVLDSHNISQPTTYHIQSLWVPGGPRCPFPK